MPGRATPTRPPRHLADLDPAERRAAAAELGGPAFRADQLARHYFARLTDDPADMTDLPHLLTSAPAEITSVASINLSYASVVISSDSAAATAVELPSMRNPRMIK